MKLIKNSRDRWSMAFTIAFAVQILVSSLCISTTAQAAEEASLSHCHQNMTYSSIQHESGHQPMQNAAAIACPHCNSPDDFTVFTHMSDTSPDSIPVAILASADFMPSPRSPAPNHSEQTQAPPRSSSTLYTTTQRIRI